MVALTVQIGFSSTKPSKKQNKTKKKGVRLSNGGFEK